MDPLLEKAVIGLITGGGAGLLIWLGPRIWRALTERPPVDDDEDDGRSQGLK